MMRTRTRTRSRSKPRLDDPPLAESNTSSNSSQEHFRRRQQPSKPYSATFVNNITGNGFPFFNFLPDPSHNVKVHRNSIDDDSDALRLHDLNTTNNAVRSREEKDLDAPSVMINNHSTCFIASDAATVSPTKAYTTRGTKTKRRLQWRVGPLIKKPRAKPKPRAHDEVSLAERTVKSIHTFHSTETEVVGNNKKGFFATGRRGIHANSSPRTASIVPSSYSSEDNDDDNLSDHGTVVEAYEGEEERELHLPQRTIGLFLYDREAFQSKSIKHTKMSKGPKPPKVPENKASARLSVIRTPPPQDYNDNSSVPSGGPLWQLARLQALSEGISSPTIEETDRDEEVSIPVEQEKVPKKRFFSFAKSSSESVASSSVASSSSQSQLELQRSHAERNLKAIHRLASQHLQFGEFDEAIDVLEESLRGVKEMCGERHYRVGTTLHNISTVHMMQKKYIDAIHVCRKAVEIRRATLGSSHPDLAVSYAQLGMAHLELEEHKFAFMAFSNALKIRKQIMSHRDLKIARLLNNIGCCLFELGKLTEATVAFDEALKIQRINMKHIQEENAIDVFSNQRSVRNAAAGSVKQNLLSIASTLCNLGSIKLRLKEYEDAAVFLEEALLIQQSVWGDKHATVANTKDSLDCINQRRNFGSNDVSTSLQDLITQKMEQVGLLSKGEKKIKYNVPNPLKIFSDVMSLDKTEWVQVLEEFGGSPLLCKTCTPIAEDGVLSSSDSLEGDLHWI